jgi:hypothetical protein
MAYGRSKSGDFDLRNPTKNWLSHYQGPHGGLGMMSYRALKRDGYNPMQIMSAFGSSGLPSIGYQMQNAMMADMAPPPPVYQAPTYNPPPVPKPKTLTTEGSTVGGGAKGVKIKRSDASKKGRNTKGTRSLNRKQRNTAMQINNLNLT